MSDKKGVIRLGTAKSCKIEARVSPELKKFVVDYAMDSGLTKSDVIRKSLIVFKNNNMLKKNVDERGYKVEQKE